jgi:hypothetical protein
VELDFAPDEAPPKGWRGTTMTQDA